jgi:hypothetical protein
MRIKPLKLNRIKRKNFLIVVFISLSLSIGIISTFNFYNSRKKINSDSSLENLLTLPYLSYVENDPNPEKKGVVYYDENLAYPGTNLYISKNKIVYLLEMDGNILHTWSLKEELSENWKLATLDKKGDLLVLMEDLGLVKMDWNSNIIWISNHSLNPNSEFGIHYKIFQSDNQMLGFHHDFDFIEGGEIYVLTGEERIIDYQSQEIPILDNSIATLDSEGVLRGTVSLYEILGEKIPKKFLDHISNKLKTGETLIMEDVDVFHSNTIEIVPRDIGVGKKGDLLICIPTLNLIGIIDLAQKELIWSWGPGILSSAHHPTILDNGNILVFDNGWNRNYSRILELDPLSGEIVWEYLSDPVESFYSKTRGSNQRLPNGNTLITDSNSGRVFEVTENGEIVWDFWNPDFDSNGKRWTIYRMTRY